MRAILGSDVWIFFRFCFTVIELTYRILPKLSTVYIPDVFIYFITIPGLLHGLREVATHERLPGLYRGIGPTLLAIAPFMAVQQSSYDVLKQQAVRHNFEPSATLFLLCGGAAGAMAQTVSRQK